MVVKSITSVDSLQFLELIMTGAERIAAMNAAKKTTQPQPQPQQPQRRQVRRVDVAQERFEDKLALYRSQQ
jgi:hypothetical protein